MTELQILFGVCCGRRGWVGVMASLDQQKSQQQQQVIIRWVKKVVKVLVILIPPDGQVCH